MSDREQLHKLIDQIAQAAHQRVDDPKNVQKGDGWTDIELAELMVRLDEETAEFSRESYWGHPNRMKAEGGDVLAFMAMMLDRTETMNRNIGEYINGR